MTRVYLVDANLVERSALRLLVKDLGMDLVGEAATWHTALVNAPASRADMVIVGWELIPTIGGEGLDELRKVCSPAVVIVLISHLEAREQAALSARADAFISRNDSPQRVGERLREAAEMMRPA